MAQDTKTWLITGCSSGFGELFVSGTLKKRLANLANTGASVLELDITASASQIEATMSHAWSLYPNGIDVVVNNAGYVLSGAVEELTQTEHVFRVNFHGPMNIIRALLHHLRAKGNGTLCFMSSQSAWYADTGASAYCATKAALEAAVECLSKELAIFTPNLELLIIEPGYFNTRLFSNINHVPARVPEYAEFNASVRDSAKAVSIMIDLIKGTGVANGKVVPLRVPLGSDGWRIIGARGESKVKICDDWEEVAKSTDLNSSREE
ncbi:NAD(P)-binding protein [Xylaria curta]|nr:NAD(P)-binding protein [Xylaria curta]